MTSLLLQYMQWFLIVCAVVCIIRLLLGPTAADRLVALNILSGVALAFLVVRGVAQERVLYLDVALVYDIFGFLGFLAIARFLKDRISDGEEM
ncbi:MAG: monovalent cation/H+ antiporter complex subunit F [Sphaerochaeta sp.]|jgi:multicomponent Na+:H+ antiporter subunit F|nr:monovalent cation/H+ antiporter complex subunit F [Sphaerochaeta sp.]PKL27999.1 MAG: pH regulation protein F [Spirochaetae bacterium HGW-Spirochaetae-2]